MTKFFVKVFEAWLVASKDFTFADMGLFDGEIDVNDPKTPSKLGPVKISEAKGPCGKLFIQHRHPISFQMLAMPGWPQLEYQRTGWDLRRARAAFPANMKASGNLMYRQDWDIVQGWCHHDKDKGTCCIPLERSGNTPYSPIHDFYLKRFHAVQQSVILYACQIFRSEYTWLSRNLIDTTKLKGLLEGGSRGLEREIKERTNVGLSATGTSLESISNRQQEITNAANLFLQICFGYGDGIPFKIKDVKKPSYLQYLISKQFEDNVHI